MPKISPTQKKIVLALKKYAKKMEGWEIEPSDRRRRLRPSRANAFLIGVMFDRSILASRAWEAAEWFNDSLGDPEDVTVLWRELLGMDKKNLLGFLRYGYGGKAFHRHYKTFARQLPEAARILLDNFNGDSRTIWNNQTDVEKVRDRLQQIPGVGLKLSRMAVLMLVRDYGLIGGKTALRQLDIVPDIHVMRVFKHCGFISIDANREEAIKVARQLNRPFPAELDPPCWEIGSKWCHPSVRLCKECPINEVCPKIKTKHI